MPFTLAHPAAAIPLCRPLGRFGVLSALVIGSMTPDLWFALPLPVSRNDSHGIAGLFWFCVPVGTGLYVAFHRWLKRPLVSLMPVAIAMRLAPIIERAPRLPRAPWGAVIVSVFIGAMTHNVWDSFTHFEGRAVRTLLPWLRTLLFSIGPVDLYGVSVLQHGTGALGVCLVAWWCWRWLKGADASTHAPDLVLARRHRLVILSLLTAVMLVAAAAATLQDAHAVRPSLRPAVFAALQAFIWGIAAYAAAWHLRRRRLASP